VTERVIKIVLDDSQIAPRLDRIEGRLGNVEAQGAQTARSFRNLAAAATTVVAALGIREFVSYGDELIRVDNRLATVTESTSNLRAVQAELLEVSFRTRTAFEDNVELFTRASAATENLGISQQTVIDLTESLSLGLRIGGATAAEASGALTQFTQGLALGRFETQELKSVLEQSVPVSRAIQKEFNATQGELLELAEAGELAADRIIDALTGDTLKEFREQLEELTPTAEEGFDQFTSAIRISLGELNRGLGLSEGLGEAFNDMAIAIVGASDEFFEFGATAVQVTSIVIGQIDLVIAGFDKIGERAALSLAEAREESGLLDTALEFLANQSEVANQQIADLPTGLEQAVRLIASPLLVAGDAVRALEDDTKSVTEAEGELNDALKNENQILITLRNSQERFNRERAKRLEDRQSGVTQDTGDGGADVVPGPDADQIKDATTFLADLRAETERARIETTLFGDEAEAALLRFESSLNIAENAGALADEINEATEALIAQNEALARQEELRANQADDTELIERLEDEVSLLGLSNEELERQTNLLELSADATEDQAQKVRDLTDALTDASREEFIESLEDELELIRLTSDERETEIALRELGAEATDAQKEAVRSLVEEMQKERDELADFQEGVEQFSEGVSTALADTIFDGLRDGFDDIENDFADFLQNLAKQLLESQLQELLTDILSNAGSDSFIGSLVSSFAGRQTGGEATRGVPIVVGETRPELFVPTEDGNILPDINSGLGMAPVIQNILDPENQLAIIETARGRNVIRNTIMGDLDFYDRILGQR